MNAQTLDQLLLPLIASTRTVLAVLRAWQSNPNPTAERDVMVSLQSVVNTLRNTPKAQMTQGEHDVFIEAETAVRALSQAVQGSTAAQVRDEFKDKMVDFLAELSSSNRKVSNLMNFKELEAVCS